MSIGQNQPVPLTPVTYPIYRGFYVIPGDTITSLSPTPIQVNFWVSRSSDNITWEGWTLVGQASFTNGFYIGHTGLDENTYYAYYCQYQYSDTSLGPVGQTVYPGRAQLIANSTLNIDQLASKAYSVGLMTAGTFRGVVFETSASNPKVRLDPTGVFATNTAGVQTFYLNAQTGAFSAIGSGASTPTITAGTIQTSTTDPRTAIDATGLWISDYTSNKILLLNQTSGLVLKSTSSYQTNASISWAATPTSGLFIGSIYTLILSSTRYITNYVTSAPIGNSQSGGLIVQTDSVTDSNNFVQAVAPHASALFPPSVYVIKGDGTSDFLQTANNLSEVTSSTARNNLGVGTGQSVTFNQLTTTNNVIVGVNINFSGGGNIVTDTTIGTKIGTAANQKLGFYNAAPVVQPTGGAGSGGFINGTSGTNVQTGFSSTGGSGFSAYTYNELIRILKNLGLITT